VLCAVIGGADNWVDVVQFGKAKKEWFATFLKLPHGIASHDTFGRVFQLLDAQALEKVCIAWLQGIAGQVQGVVAIDGKTLRGSGYAGHSALHIVSAWACEASMLLGQVQTDKKSNEITAIPELLKLLSIKGCIVTIDAMGCQKAITKAIVDSEADYVLSLKANHPHLHGEVASWFEPQHAGAQAQAPHSHYEQYAQTNNHGRIERREHWLMEVPEHLKRATKYWTNLQTIAMVRRTRRVGEKTSEETHYLHQQSALERRRAAHRPRRAQPLGGGERAAMVAGREFQGGRLTCAQGRRSGQSGVCAPPCLDPTQSRDQPQGQH